MNTKTHFGIGLTVLAALGFGARASAAAVSHSFSFSTPMDIPDADGSGATGIANSQTLGFFASGSKITSVQVSLDVQGGFNGDYYASLRHVTSDGTTTGYSVLLNRVGVGLTGDSYGYSDAGLNVFFDDSASHDIHQYGLTASPNGGVLTGNWQPDGRADDPSVVTDASQRLDILKLSSFQGLDPNGLWTLFIEDESSGGSGTLKSWGLTINAQVAAVPEPSTALAGAFMLFVTLMRFHWRSGKQ